MARAAYLNLLQVRFLHMQTRLLNEKVHRTCVLTDNRIRRDHMTHPDLCRNKKK